MRLPGLLGLALVCLTFIPLMSCRTSSHKSADAEVKSQDAGKSASFVKANGIEFELDGKPFRFQGTNFYRLALTDRQYTDEEIGDIMQKYADAGIQVLRFWGFSCDTPKEWEAEGVTRGGITRVPILDRSGKVQEEALVQVDRVLAQAAKKGIKVIYPLVNFEHEYCGMEWWNHVYGNKKESKQGFYCNDKVRTAFKDYVANLLKRRNTVSGVAYKDDPTILAIELANEPHTEDNYETKGSVDESCKSFADGKPGTIVHKWLKEMSEHVRSVDANHMISTGEEGYRTSGDTSKHSWIHNGMKGVDFERNLQLPLISFATVHLYPDNSDIPRSDFHSWYVPQVIADRARIAHRYGKPIVLEETGFGELTSDTSSYMNKVRSTGYAAERPKWIGEMYKAAFDAKYAGTMIWQVVPTNKNGSAYDDDLFTFSIKDKDMAAIRDQIARLKGESPATPPAEGEIPWCRDASTDADAQGVKDGWGFEDGRSCRVRP